MTSTLNVIFTLSRVSNLPRCGQIAWQHGRSINRLRKLLVKLQNGIILLLRLGHIRMVTFGASFIYAGGCVLNDAYDQKFDQEYNPDRPIPSGEIKASTVWMVGGARY